MTGQHVAVVVVACAGLGGAFLAGAPPGAVLPLAAAVLAAPFVGGRLAWVPWSLLTAAVLGILTAGAVGAGWPPGGVLALALGWLLVRRVLGRQGPGDDRIVVLLAALLVVLAGSLSTGPAWLAAFVPWLVAAPLVLERAQVVASGARARGRRDDRMPVGLAGAGAAGAAVLFLVLPRPALEVQGGAGPALTGFAPEVALGDLGVLLDDPTPVLRVRIDGPARAPIYLRGSILDRFDGRRWTRSTGPSPWEPGPVEGAWRVEVEEIAPVENVLFSVGEPVGLDAAGLEVLRDPDGGLWATRPDRPLTYTVHARPVPIGGGEPVGGGEPAAAASEAVAPLSASEQQRLTALPADLDPRIAALAERVTGSSAAPARAVGDWLRAEMDYTRAPRDAQPEEPLSTFLFDTRQGHCEYFASAAVVLLRSQGVPARLVNGFVGGERNEFGGWWLFRRVHAHSWVEYWDGGWRVLEATPGAAAPTVATPPARLAEAARVLWTDRVVGYDRGVQTAVVLGAGHWLQERLAPERAAGVPWLGLLLLGLALFALVVLAAWLARRFGPRLLGRRASARPRGPVERAWSRALEGLAAAGWRPPESLPPVSAARWVRARAGNDAEPLERLAWLLYEVRYGGGDPGPMTQEARVLAEAAGRIPPPAERAGA